MKKQFQLQLIYGLPYIETENEVILVDTGSPHSAHTGLMIDFMGSTYFTKTPGDFIEQLNKHVLKPITTLLGMDILCHYNLLIDYKNSTIEFSTINTAIEGSQLPLTYHQGLPGIRFTSEGQLMQIMLITASWYSGLTRQHTLELDNGKLITTLGKNFNPCQAWCYHGITLFNGRSFPTRYLEITGPDIAYWSDTGIDGYWGFDFFNHHQVVFNFQNHKIIYRNYQSFDDPIKKKFYDKKHQLNLTR